MKKLLIFTTLFVAITIVAWALFTGTQAPAVDFSKFEDMRQGDMRKLQFTTDPQKVSVKPFVQEDDTLDTLDQYLGKVVVLNFWATWCAPCRNEMPHLSDLQKELGNDDFQVVTIATGRNDLMSIKAFFREIGVNNLPLYRDPKSEIARDMAVLGLPVTVIINRQGQEIARLKGDADWSSDPAKAILQSLIDDLS